MTKRKWATDGGVLVLAVATVGALVWSGCGSPNDGCDGYSCGGAVYPTPSATVDSGTTAEAGQSTPDTGVDAGPTCGGALGPCACTSGADCATGQACVGGTCTSSSNACVYSSQCPPGDVCADGACLPDCSVTSCAAGSTCTKGVCEPNPTTGSPCTTSSQCPASAPICVAGTCAASCTADTQCPAGDYCNQGACEVDTRPKPNCAQTSDCKGQEPQECLGGFCVFTCSTSSQCLLIDARIGVCTAQGYCATGVEANPACKVKSDCPAGEDCIGNVCK